MPKAQQQEVEAWVKQKDAPALNPLLQLRRISIPSTIKLVHLFVALAVLISGMWVYIVERAPEAAPFFSTVSLYHRLPSVLGAVSASLPSFAHAFSFSIITALAMGPRRRLVLWSCLSWLFINFVFEIGQHSTVSSTIGSSPLFSETLSSYFEAGTFDPIDLFSIFLGVTTAYLLLTSTVVSQDTKPPD